MPVTTDTATNLLAGAGEVYREQDPVGASEDANSVRIERELITPELNGLKGTLLGTDYVRRSEGILETTILEIGGSSSFAYAWPGSTTDGTGTVTVDESNTRRIPTTDYADWEIQWERLGGGEVQFEVDNAIHRGGLDIEAGDDGFVKTRLELHSTWDPADLTNSPHRFKIMDAVS